ncbi:MAG: glycosyltransferase family 2 protein [Chloroflexi bacterium]|nr:glycosyltransferase family 2 protein [Chloroflexota bacterium]
MPDSTHTTGQLNIVAVIPAHNEERFIGSVVLQARQHAHTVIVVDDGSTDATARIAAAAAGATVIRHERNLGKGAAFNTGFAAAQELSPDAVVVLDADGQHQADEIPLVTAPVLSGEADMVVGSRFLQPDGAIPGWRSLGMRALTMLTNLASRLPLSDSQTGFRAFSRQALLGLDLQSQGFSAESEMQFQARQLGFRIVEVPISVTYAEGPKRNPFAHGMQVINGILRLIGQHRPLLFFGLPGLLLLLVGLGWGYWVVGIYRRTQQLAVGYTLLAALLCIVGSVALSTGITLHSLRGLLLELLGRKNGNGHRQAR